MPHLPLRLAACLCAALALPTSRPAVAQRPPGDAASAPAPLTAAERRRALDSAAVLLGARYQDAARGQLLADSLRAWARRDAFAAVATPVAFADSLGRALQGVVADKHLYLRHLPAVEFVQGTGAGRVEDRPAEPSAAAGTAGADPRAATATPGPGVVRRSGRVDPRDSATIARTNFGFARAERLEGNVGYLKLERLVPPDWARGTADAALGFLRHTDAVIIDVRDVPGGAPQMMQYLLSHFFQGPATLLHASYMRAEQVADSVWSLPALSERGLGGKPLFILTSARSASAAEMLAYVARRLGVGTVVGETTSGAGNGGRPFTVGSGLHLFVPERRVLTGPGWEQTGVVPDVAVAAEEALAAAHRLARERLSATPAARR